MAILSEAGKDFGMAKETYVSFGQKMRASRKRMGLRQEDLAKKVGLSATSIAKIESGKHFILFHNAHKIAQFLKFSLDDLRPEDSELTSAIDSQSPKVRDALKAVMRIIKGEAPCESSV